MFIVIGVINCNRVEIIKNCHGISKVNAVLFKIAFSLMMIPFKIHVLIVCTNCVRVKKKYRLERNTENKREIEKRLPDENLSCSAAEV